MEEVVSNETNEETQIFPFGLVIGLVILTFQIQSLILFLKIDYSHKRER